MSLGLRSNIHSYGIFNSLLNFAADIPDFTAAYSLRYLTINAIGKPVVRVRRDSDQSEKDFTPFDFQSSNLSNFIYSVSEKPADFDGGAVAAYSLRYVTSSLKEGNPVVQVRKDIITNPTRDFTPDELTNGTLDKFADGNDCYVSIWYDQKGSNDAIQTYAAYQPKIYDAVNGLITENGKPAISFNGVDEYFSVPDSKAAFKFLHDGTTATTFSTVRLGDGSAVSDVRYIIFATTVATADVGASLYYDDRTIVPRSDALVGQIFRGVSGTAVCSSDVDDTFLPNTQSLVYGLYDADNATASERFRGAVNGDADSSNNTDTNAPSTGNATNDLQIGRYLLGSGVTDAYLLGNMQELIFYDTDQSANRKAIENTINNYYNIYSSQTEAFVSIWYDQSGNGYHAVQVAGANQPKIWDASIGLVTENEKPAIEFDGVDDFLTSQQIVLIDDITMIAIASQKSYNVGFVFGQGNGFTSVNSTQQQATIGFSTSTIQFELKPDNFNEISGAISYILNDRYLIIGNYSRGNHFYFYTNGLISNFIDNVPDSPIENYQTPLAIGRSVSRNNFTLDGTIQELFLYTNNQINNIALLQNNLNQYYIIFGPLRYNQRITEDSGTFALTDRYEAVYDEVTEIATPSLLCTCDAYKESTLTTYGTLYNIIPA